MSKKSLGEIIQCDVCKKAQIAIPTDVKINLDYCAISGDQRGLEIIVKSYGYYGAQLDICKDCRIEALEKAIKSLRRLNCPPA